MREGRKKDVLEAREYADWKLIIEVYSDVEEFPALEYKLAESRAIKW